MKGYFWNYKKYCERPRQIDNEISCNYEDIYFANSKSFGNHPLKMELKSPVIVKGCACVSLQTASNGGVKDGN